MGLTATDRAAAASGEHSQQMTCAADPVQIRLVDVTNLPPPPPPGGGAIPPPPPPNLIAPAGYTGYTASPMGSVPLKRVGGIGRASMIVVALAAIFAALTVVTSQTMTDEAEAFLAGDTPSDDFIESIAPYLLLSFVQGAVVIASMVLVMIWMFRIAANHRTLHRGATWGPGWAIGGWFLPPLLYIIPTLMFSEMWRASDPDVPIGGEWKSRPVSPLIWVWFVVYSLVPIGLMFAQTDSVLSGFGGSDDELAKQISGDQGIVMVGTAITLVAAVVFIAFARALTNRHQHLTGEATG